MYFSLILFLCSYPLFQDRLQALIHPVLRTLDHQAALGLPAPPPQIAQIASLHKGKLANGDHLFEKFPLSPASIGVLSFKGFLHGLNNLDFVLELGYKSILRS